MTPNPILAFAGALALADNVEAAQLARTEAAGYDACKNGPSDENCHIRHFATKERLDAWEQGRARAKADEIKGGQAE